MLSMLNYYRLRDPKATWTDETFVRLFIRDGADQGSLRNGFGTLEQNFLAWSAQRRFPLLLTSYEALKADTPRELRRMLTFLGETIDETRLRAAVEASTFDRMRALEARE